MTVLTLMVAVLTSCSKDDNYIEELQQSPQSDNVITLTTTVSIDGSQAATRALTAEGVKTFKAGDKIAVCYKTSNSDGYIKVVDSNALTADDISADGKSAKFTVNLNSTGYPPLPGGSVKYIYPAAMAMAGGQGAVDYSKLVEQDGTLSGLADNYDLAIFEGTLTDETTPNLPASATLQNQLAICAFTIKDADGTHDITNTITSMFITDGSNNYVVNRTAAAGPIYVAMQPTDNADINYWAAGESVCYTKSVTSKTYAAGHIYQLGLRMSGSTETVGLWTLTGSSYTATNGKILTGNSNIYNKNSRDYNIKISIADGATITLKDVTINGMTGQNADWAGITCEGNATIILEGTNRVRGFASGYPGIYVPEGKTLTIQGNGTLYASSNFDGAGIGGGYVYPNSINCGNIEIKGGTIVAVGGTLEGFNDTREGNAAGIGSGFKASCGYITISGGTITALGSKNAAGIGSGCCASCGNILINGGTVNATGRKNAAGIGSGYTWPDAPIASCGTITITNGVTSVTATKGTDATYSIGPGDGGSTCGKVTIGGTEYWDGSSAGTSTYLTQSPLVYPAP